MKKIIFTSYLLFSFIINTSKSFSFLLLKFSSLRSFIDGSPRILIYKGEILFNNLKKEAYTIDDLLNQIHQEGILDISEVNLAILETSGTLAVFSKKRYKEIFLPVVISGKLENENIKLLGLSKNYILKRLNEKSLSLKILHFIPYQK